MIVRIATDGQYELPQDAELRLNELDNAAVAAVEASDETGFRAVYAELVDYVREYPRLPEDQLSGSDLILPPPDVSLEEARAEFTGEGLLPG